MFTKDTVKITCSRCKDEMKDVLAHWKKYHPAEYKKYFGKRK